MTTHAGVSFLPCPPLTLALHQALSMRVDRIIALQINDRISREGGGK